MAMLKGCVSAICSILPTNINLLGYNVSTIIYHRYNYIDKNYILSASNYMYFLYSLNKYETLLATDNCATESVEDWQSNMLKSD